MTIEWCGIVKSNIFSQDECNLRKQIAKVIKAHQWNKAFLLLQERPDLINATFLDEMSWYAPVHQITFDNSPIEIVEKILSIGAWRTLKNSDGNKPVDIANKEGYQNLALLLKPIYRRHINLETLSKIQAHFHKVIIGRIEHTIPEWASFRLPDLEILLEIEQPRMWFPVPGMYGGFSYKLEIEGENVKLISESWCRVVGGSGERHEITAEGSKLVEQGFV